LELQKEKDNKPIKDYNRLPHVHGREKNGVVKTMFDRIVDQQKRDRALSKLLNRMTAETALNAGTVNLTDERVHQRVNEKVRMRELSQIDAIE
jgi:PBP1b-binding outer membrane lipoprotein LpoB